MESIANIEGLDDVIDSPDSHKCIGDQNCPECTSLTPILKHILQHLTESNRHKSTDLSVPHDAGFSQKLSWYFECESCSYKSFYQQDILRHTRETHMVSTNLRSYGSSGSSGSPGVFAPPPSQSHSEVRFSRKRLNPKPSYSSYKRRYQPAATATVPPTSHHVSLSPGPLSALPTQIPTALPSLISGSPANDDSNQSSDNNQAPVSQPITTNATTATASTETTSIPAADPTPSTSTTTELEGVVGVKAETEDDPGNQGVLLTDMMEDPYDSSSDFHEPVSRQSARHSCKKKRSSAGATIPKAKPCSVSLRENCYQKNQRIRRRKNYSYSEEQRAIIGKYAVDYGNTATRKKFSEELGFDIPESSIRNFKKNYLAC